MKSKLSCITLVLMVLCFGFWHSNAYAQCQYVQPDGVDIVPEATPLEIVGGNLLGSPIPGSDIPSTTHDSFVYINQGDTTNLHVALINQSSLEAQFSSFPVNPAPFGFPDRMVNTLTTGLVFCFIDGADFINGGTPTVAYSMDGLNFNTNPLGAANTYDNCTVIRDDDNFVTDNIVFMAHNTATQALDFWKSNDGGMTWVLDPTTVTNVLGPLDGGAVPTVTRGSGNAYITFYSRQTGPGQMENVLKNTETGFTKVLNNDVIDQSKLIDGCATRKNNKNIVWYYDRQNDQQRAWFYSQAFGTDFEGTADNFFNAPAPNFDGPGNLGFFGGGCIHTPDGPGNPQGIDFGLSMPWGNTYSVAINGTTEVFQTNPLRDPTRNTMSGPVGLTKLHVDNFIIPQFSDEPDFYSGWDAGWDGSFQYAQCVFREQTVIPTLSEWGLMLAAIVLLAAALFVLRRSSKASEV